MAEGHRNVVQNNERHTQWYLVAAGLQAGRRSIANIRDVRKGVSKPGCSRFDLGSPVGIIAGRLADHTGWSRLIAGRPEGRPLQYLLASERPPASPRTNNSRCDHWDWAARTCVCPQESRARKRGRDRWCPACRARPVGSARAVCRALRAAPARPSRQPARRSRDGSGGSCQQRARARLILLAGQIVMPGVARGTMLVMPYPHSGSRSSSAIRDRLRHQTRLEQQLPEAIREAGKMVSRSAPSGFRD